MDCFLRTGSTTKVTTLLLNVTEGSSRTQAARMVYQVKELKNILNTFRETRITTLNTITNTSDFVVLSSIG